MLTVGKVTFVRSVTGVPSGFLSLLNTGIVVGKPAVAAGQTGIATGAGVIVTVTFAVSHTLGFVLSQTVYTNVSVPLVPGFGV